MGFSEIILLLSGVALFLFGMSIMGDSLKKLSGNKLEPILYKLSGTTLKGVLLGTGVTAAIQSSCATAVMTVGFVNSGMMKVKQGISVILGAILGTSITGWVICLSYLDGSSGIAKILSTATLTGIVAVVGIVLRMFTKKQITKYIGDILMGFAVLMFGMSTMSSSVSELGNMEWFRSVMTSMENPFLGIIVGTVFTAVLQSASAAVGIVQALSFTGAMTFDAAFPILLGISFGASAPVLFAAIGANPKGRRTALVYPIATGFGMIICACLFYIFNAIFSFEFTSTVMNPFSIAGVNTIIRLIMVVILIPLIDVIEAVVTAIVPEKKSDAKDPGVRLEERFIAHPALAIEQSGITVNEMADISEEAFKEAVYLFSEYSDKAFARVDEMEKSVDVYEDSLGTYLIKLTGHEMTAQQNEKVSEYLHTISDFERISDHALNLAQSAKELYEKGEKFSEKARHEFNVLSSAVSTVINMAVTAFKNDDLELAARVEPLEEVIDDLCDRLKINHVDRLQKGECTIATGFVFNDVITNCERVSDHCSNIAVALIELSLNAFQTHEYVDSLKERESEKFKAEYEKFAKQFAL